MGTELDPSRPNCKKGLELTGRRDPKAGSSDRLVQGCLPSPRLEPGYGDIGGRQGGTGSESPEVFVPHPQSYLRGSLDTVLWSRGISLHRKSVKVIKNSGGKKTLGTSGC